VRYVQDVMYEQICEERKEVLGTFILKIFMGHYGISDNERNACKQALH
jgi:hypothetical protein